MDLQTELLATIRAEQSSQHARRMALLDDPATQARVALAESLGAELAAAGFDPHHQQIFNIDRYRAGGDVHIIVHAHILAAHWLAGVVAIAEILQKRAGHLDGTQQTYTEAGHRIELCLHANNIGRGWAPRWAAQAA